jgi:hypothetical protein
LSYVNPNPYNILQSTSFHSFLDSLTKTSFPYHSF